MQNEIEHYLIESKIEEAPGVVTLVMTHENGDIPTFVAGQYITVYVPELSTPEGKAYSISSAPHEQSFSITVRAIGEFSKYLCARSPGESIQASLPYGFFCPESGESDIVMVASGIGITPFRSMLRDIALKNPKRRVCLFHSIRVSSDAVFRQELHDLKNKLPNFSMFHFVTRENSGTIPGAAHRHIELDDILPHVLSPTTTEFLICGSISFTRDLWRALRHANVPEDHVYTEAFFSH